MLKFLREGRDFMKRICRVLVSAMMSGVFLAIAGLAYFKTSPYSMIVASFIFAFGLFFIINFNLYLFTGKIGFIKGQNKSYYLDLLVGIIGNFIGCFVIGYLFYFASKGNAGLESIITLAKEVTTNKLSLTWYQNLLLSFFCGINVHIACDISKRNVSAGIKTCAIFLAVGVFVICGFEHCIANMFYYSIANAWSLKTIGYTLLTILGNSLGALFTYFVLDFVSKLNNKVKENENEKSH